MSSSTGRVIDWLDDGHRKGVINREFLHDDVGVVELRQLEHFLAVVEEGSFTAAAARVYMVQSSLSASLLALERGLGTQLFIRGRRGAELTDAGRSLVGPARAALDAVLQGRQAIAEVKGLLQGTVRIATVSPTLPRRIDFCDTIGWFRELHPGVDVQVVPADARSMIDLMADGRVDFAVTPQPDCMTPKLRFESLIRTRLVLVCPAGHRFAGARDVPPQELLKEPVVDLPRSWQSRHLLEQVLQEHGLQRRVRLEVEDWLGALTMVQRGMGIAYGPADIIDATIFGGLTIATLAGAPVWDLGIVTRDEGIGPAGRAFLADYLEQCRRRTGADQREVPSIVGSNSTVAAGNPAA